MAWRESRTHRRRLLLCSASIVLGIAALTAIGSLGRNLEGAIEEQAKSLLGADLVIGSRQPFSVEQEKLIAGLGGEQAREVSFSSMVYFPGSERTRLVQVRAVEGGFPFYGRLESEPAAAAAEFRRAGAVLVEQALLTQFEAKPGDTVRLGNLTLPIAGALLKVPGETVAFATIAPRVYLAMDQLPRSGLLREGSLARYRVAFRFGAGVDVAGLVTRIKPQLDALRLSASTVEERKRDLGRAMENLYHFLSLVGFIALLLGGVGVGSAVQVHVKQKLGNVAVLRCLGASIAQTFAIYLAQGMALGVAGSILGAGLGVLVQVLLPGVLSDFIPFRFTFSISWLAIARAMAIGFAVCLLFALWPLLAVRRVSPLATLRAAFETPAPGSDPLRWLVGLGLAGGVAAFALLQGRDWRIGLGFTAGLAAAFGVLAITARLLVWLTRRWVSPSLGFVWRQGLANLHRPNNRTLSLLLALGLGTFLLVSLELVRQTLLTQLVQGAGGSQPNAVLFDIQSDQREAVIRLVRSLNLPVVDEAPVVTMRLSAVAGRTVESILADNQSRIPRWTLRREYRCTYRDSLRDGERQISGAWPPAPSSAASSPAGEGAPVPVSVEEGIAKELQIRLGDELGFDVQGVPLRARVVCLREVDWRRVQPNFFVVFPTGALEAAPTMHILVTRVSSPAESARLQREVVRSFPTVSAIDLTLVLQTLDSILEKISFVIRFMAMFTVLTGLLVLVGALLSGADQRLQESVLLRTLGAARGQIFRTLFAEYFALGFLAALTGVVLACLGAWGLSAWVFKVKFALQLGAPALALVLVPAVTVATGLLTSRALLNQPPLAVLRGA